MAALFALWRDFLRDLGKPEYVHVLLNPLPTYGLALATLGLAAAVFARSRAAQAIALGGVTLCSASAWVVAYYGRAAYDRVYSMSDEDAQHWLDWHAYLASRIVWADAAAAALALFALLALWRFPRAARAGLGWSLGSAFVAVLLGFFLAFVGGKIRHSEFRHGPPPVIVPSPESDA